MKKWYQSKTIWVNMLTAIIGIVTATSNADWVTSHPQLSALLVSLIGGTNILLRWVTDSPIAKWLFKDKESSLIDSVPEANRHLHINIKGEL